MHWPKKDLHTKKWLIAPLHLVARKSCICKKILHLQENLAFARKSCFCKISWLIETAMHLSKKMLHLQEKSCLYKKILRLQENLAKARNLCICNKILQKQEYLSTKCTGALCVSMCKLQITPLCSCTVNKVWDFGHKRGQFPSSSDISDTCGYMFKNVIAILWRSLSTF